MYEEILRRLENISIVRSQMKDYEWQATSEFWQNVENDLRWAMNELRKFHECDDGPAHVEVPRQGMGPVDAAINCDCGERFVRRMDFEAHQKENRNDG